MAAADPARIRQLVEDAPLQGLTRFHQKYDLIDIMQEDRLLRAIIVAQVEGQLARQMTQAEAAALHATIGTMLQRAVVAPVDQQKAGLRTAERELKYLSFLSHDLNNNLAGVTLTLEMLRQQVLAQPACAPAAADHIEAGGRAIRNTIDGMRRVLDHERLRKGAAEPQLAQVDLRALADHPLGQHQREADAKQLAPLADVPPGAIARTDPDLVLLVLQNLVGNAVKYSTRGTVRVAAEHRREGDAARGVLSVADQRPGIVSDDRQRIFDAFSRAAKFTAGRASASAWPSPPRRPSCSTPNSPSTPPRPRRHRPPRLARGMTRTPAHSPRPPLRSQNVFRGDARVTLQRRLFPLLPLPPYSGGGGWGAGQAARGVGTARSHSAILPLPRTRGRGQGR